MNYFAHAYPALITGNPNPYYLAGLAVPDWLSVAARRTKCRTKHVERYLDSDDKSRASLSQGIAQHHADDLWFHNTRAFIELSLNFAVQLRNALQDQRDLRASFLGHILVELLLDSELIADDPALLDSYYDSVGQANSKFIAEQVSVMCGKPVTALAEFVEKFVEIRFLADYADDELLCFRVNQVLGRVGLPVLPAAFDGLLPALRYQVRWHRAALITREDSFA